MKTYLPLDPATSDTELAEGLTEARGRASEATGADLNLVVICGRLAVDAEARSFDSGRMVVRLLVTTRTEEPHRRVDVIPVTMPAPEPELLDRLPRRGERVRACGSVQRRFWDAPDGRRSRVEVVAEQVHVKGED